MDTRKEGVSLPSFMKETKLKPFFLHDDNLVFLNKAFRMANFYSFAIRMKQMSGTYPLFILKKEAYIKWP